MEMNKAEIGDYFDVSKQLSCEKFELLLNSHEDHHEMDAIYPTEQFSPGSLPQAVDSLHHLNLPCQKKPGGRKRFVDFFRRKKHSLDIQNPPVKLSTKNNSSQHREALAAKSPGVFSCFHNWFSHPAKNSKKLKQSQEVNTREFTQQQLLADNSLNGAGIVANAYVEMEVEQADKMACLCDDDHEALEVHQCEHVSNVCHSPSSVGSHKEANDGSTHPSSNLLGLPESTEVVEELARCSITPKPDKMEFHMLGLEHSGLDQWSAVQIPNNFAGDAGLEQTALDDMFFESDPNLPNENVMFWENVGSKSQGGYSSCKNMSVQWPWEESFLQNVDGNNEIDSLFSKQAVEENRHRTRMLELLSEILKRQEALVENGSKQLFELLEREESIKQESENLGNFTINNFNNNVAESNDLGIPADNNDQESQEVMIMENDPADKISVSDEEEEETLVMKSSGRQSASSCNHDDKDPDGNDDDIGLS